MGGTIPRYFRVMKPIIPGCKAYNPPITIQQKKPDDFKSLMKYLQPNAVRLLDLMSRVMRTEIMMLQKISQEFCME